MLSWRVELKVHCWFVEWVDLLCAILGILTFTLYRPDWGFTYRIWYTRRGYNKRKSK